VPWEYEEIIPDYVMGRTTCALFLSLRYHNLNPDYINERLKQLGKQYELRVLLVQVLLASLEFSSSVPLPPPSHYVHITWDD
jgi:DNA repair protein Rad10